MSRISPTQEQVNYLSSLGNPGLAASSAPSVGGGKKQPAVSKKPRPNQTESVSAAVNLPFGHFFRMVFKVVLFIILAIVLISIAQEVFAANQAIGPITPGPVIMVEQSISDQLWSQEPVPYPFEAVEVTQVDRLLKEIHTIDFLLKATLVLFILNLFLLWRFFVMHQKIELYKLQELGTPAIAKTEIGKVQEPSDSLEEAQPAENSSAHHSVTTPKSQKAGATPAKQHKLYKLPTILPPAEMLRCVTHQAEKSLKKLYFPPSFPVAPWSVGYASVTGNVRKENQDYGIAFQINGYDVLIVADGVGGTPLGKEASYTAATRATYSLIHQVNKAHHWQSLNTKTMAEMAMDDAQKCLLAHGGKMDITNVAGGFRTTLIIVVANKKSYGFSHIGDGSGILIRNGQSRVLFQPHKAGEGYAANVIAASLGATEQGKATSGGELRMSGDLISICTDGVSDYVDDDFSITDLLQHCLRKQGDLSATTTDLMKCLADYEDEVGFVCSDNLTLAVMGTGEKPLIPKGFWHKQAGGGENSTININNQVI